MTNLATLKIVKPDGSEYPVTAIVVLRDACLIYTADETYTPARDDPFRLQGITAP